MQLATVAAFLKLQHVHQRQQMSSPLQLCRLSVSWLSACVPLCHHTQAPDFWVLQAEQVAREPATPDVRLMRDFADMRPVDIARAYGYQRIAALLDPGRPVELLAYITAGEGTQCPIARPEAIEQGASAA